MNTDRWISIITGAALLGLLILHPAGAARVIQALGDATTQYAKTIQGR